MLATAPLDADGIDQLAVSGGKVYFSQSRQGGVYSVPLGGGTVERVENAGEFHLLAWPWVGSGGRHAAYSDADAFVEVLNVETGERNTAVVNPGETKVSCDVLICTGQRGDKGFVRSRDGSGERELPGGGGGPSMPAQGRFHTMVTDDGVALHDLTTGKSGDLGLRRDEKGGMQMPYPSDDGRLLAYPLGDQFVIVDLSKIK